MDYLPLPEAPPFEWSVLPFLPVFIVLAATLVATLILTLRKKKYDSVHQRIVTVLLTLWFFASLFTGAGSMGAIATYGHGVDQNRTQWEETVTEQINAHYGLTLTKAAVRELGYPAQEPSDKTYYNTIELSTGEDVTAYGAVQLAIADGQAYLLTQEGATYTELPSTESE